MNKGKFGMATLPFNVWNIRDRQKFTEAQGPNRSGRLITKSGRISIFRVVNTNTPGFSLVRSPFPSWALFYPIT